MGRAESRYAIKKYRSSRMASDYYIPPKQTAKTLQATEKEIIKKIDLLSEEELDDFFCVEYKGATINLLDYLGMVISELKERRVIVSAVIERIKALLEKHPDMIHKTMEPYTKPSTKNIVVEDAPMPVAQKDKTILSLPIPNDSIFHSDMTNFLNFADSISRTETAKAVLCALFRNYGNLCFSPRANAPYYDHIPKEVSSCPMVGPFYLYLSYKWMLQKLKVLEIGTGFLPHPFNLESILERTMPDTSAYFRIILKNETGDSAMSSQDKNALWTERQNEYIEYSPTGKGLYEKMQEFVETIEDQDIKKDLWEIFYSQIRALLWQSWMDYESAKKIKDQNIYETSSVPLVISEASLQYVYSITMKDAQKTDAIDEYEDKIEEWEQKYDTLKKETDKLKKSYDALKKEKESIEKEIGVTPELLTIAESERDECQSKYLEEQKKTEALLNDQYAIMRKLALMRTENAKLKRQITVRDALNITPQTKDTLDQIESFCESVPREQKIAFLKDKSIILVGGSKSNIASALISSGLKNIDEKYDDGKIKGKYDIYVCLIKKMSHSQDDQTTKAAKTNNAVLIYFDYMNADRLIDEMYEACINKLDK